MHVNYLHGLADVFFGENGSPVIFEVLLVARSGLEDVFSFSLQGRYWGVVRPLPAQIILFPTLTAIEQSCLLFKCNWDCFNPYSYL